VQIDVEGEEPGAVAGEEKGETNLELFCFLFWQFYY
jgi:hypothetical protein